MKKRVNLALKIMVVFLVLCCIGALIWYFYQRHTLKNESIEFLNQYWKYSHFEELFQKEAKDISEEDRQSWEREVKKFLAEYVPENTHIYEGIYEEIHDNFMYGLEQEKKERVKETTAKIICVNSCRITSDTADCAFLTRETSEKYDGTNNTSKIVYTYHYEWENGKWMIKSWGYDFPDV